MPAALATYFFTCSMAIAAVGGHRVLSEASRMSPEEWPVYLILAGSYGLADSAIGTLFSLNKTAQTVEIAMIKRKLCGKLQ